MIFLLVVIAVFGLDYFVKDYIEKHRVTGQEEPVLGGAILIRRFSNRGAATGFLKDKPEVVKWGSGLLMIVMGIHFIRELFQKGNSMWKLCYSFILGGGLSNLYDRMKKGAVTDYFSFQVPVKKIRNLIFNISDLFIIIGAVVMVLIHLFEAEKR